MASPTALPMAALAMRGGTRWRRTALVLVPALIGVAVLVVATLRGPIPLNLVVSGQDMKLTSNGGLVELPQGLTLYPSTIEMKNGGETRGVVIAGLPEAVLTKGLCLSLVITLPGLGANTIRLHTSGETTAREMTLDAAGIRTSGATLMPTLTDGDAGELLLPITLGKDARDLAGTPDVPAGRFGVEAPGAGSLTGLQASAQGAVISGSVKLDGLSVRLDRGSGIDAGECY